MSLIDHFPTDILKDMFDYGDGLLKERQSNCVHDWAQFMFGIVLNSPVIETPYGTQARYSLASCVKCYKIGYYDIVTKEYVEHFDVEE